MPLPKLVTLNVILTWHLGETNGDIKVAILKSIKPGYYRELRYLTLQNGTRAELEQIGFFPLWERFKKNNQLLGDSCEEEKRRFASGEIQRLWSLPAEEREGLKEWNDILGYMMVTAQEQQELNNEQDLIKDIMKKTYNCTITITDPDTGIQG